MSERSSPNLALVSITAGLAGAGIALLLAPRSGKETRAQLQEKADELKNQANEGFSDMKRTVSTGFEHTKDRLSEAISNVGKKTNQAYNELDSRQHRTDTKQSPVLRAWEEEV